MIDILFDVGVSIVGGLAGGIAAYFIGKALKKYWEKAKTWFDQIWQSIKRVTRAVGLLVRKGKRLFKRFVTLLVNGEVEEYIDQSDEGIEVEPGQLSPEAIKALNEDECIVVACYE